MKFHTDPGIVGMSSESRTRTGARVHSTPLRLMVRVALSAKKLHIEADGLWRPVRRPPHLTGTATKTTTNKGLKMVEREDLELVCYPGAVRPLPSPSVR